MTGMMCRRCSQCSPAIMIKCTKEGCEARIYLETEANMVKSVDTPDLKSDGETHPGSIPGVGTRIIAYCEPWELGEEQGYINAEIRMTEKDAIKWAIAAAFKAKPTFRYESDEQALDDFKAIHFAYYPE